MKQAERIGWIDTLRAFAVFAIVLGHTLRNATVVYPWLYSFHVPLCVLTSGIVFHVGQKKVWYISKRKIQSTHDSVLLLCTHQHCSLCNTWQQNGKNCRGYDVSPLQSVIGMLYANSGTGLMRWNMPLWYIPMIFVLLLMAFWIFRSKDNLKWNITVFLLSVLVAFILYEKIRLPNLPFGLETAIYMFPFFALGKVIGSVKGEFTRKSILVKIAVTVGCLAVGTFMTIGNGQVSYNADSYGTHGFGYFLVMAIMLCVGFVSLAMCFPNGVTPINYVGRNTVGIMVMHEFTILFFVGLFPISKKLIGTYPLVASIMIAILSIGMCLAASEVIYRVCPIALGKRKR